MECPKCGKTMRVTHTLNPTPQSKCQRLECSSCGTTQTAATVVMFTDPQPGQGVHSISKQIAAGKVSVQLSS